MMMKGMVTMMMIMSRMMMMMMMLPLAQRNGGKVSRFGAEKRRQGVTEKVWKGRGWRREGGVRRKEEGGRRREGEKRTVVEGVRKRN